LLQLNQSLEKITSYRQQYVDNPSDNSKQALINENSAFSDILGNTIALPSFRIYTERARIKQNSDLVNASINDLMTSSDSLYLVNQALDRLIKAT
jgi:hypothetical protein